MDDDLRIASAIQAVIEGRSLDPFAVLGRQRAASGDILRVMVPGAFAVTAIARDEPSLQATLSPMRNTGLFTGPSPGSGPYLLRIDWGGPIQETEDPYSFGPLLGELDVYLLAEGKHRDLASCLGGHTMLVDGVAGVRFAVWAPNARRASVVGDFSTWDGRHPMRLRHGQAFGSSSSAGHAAPLQIRTASLTARPTAESRSGGVAGRTASGTASVVNGPAPFRWSDDAGARAGPAAGAGHDLRGACGSAPPPGRTSL
jgi:1,4-alpha-glucan branching enzyme